MKCTGNNFCKTLHIILFEKHHVLKESHVVYKCYIPKWIRLLTCYLLFVSVSLNEVSLLVDTTHLKRFGLWKNKDDDHSKRSHAILFLWVSANYLQEIQTQLENSILSQHCEYEMTSKFWNNLRSPVYSFFLKEFNRM